MRVNRDRRLVFQCCIPTTTPSSPLSPPLLLPLRLPRILPPIIPPYPLALRRRRRRLGRLVGPPLGWPPPPPRGDVLTKENVKNLWELLRVFRPNDPHLEDKTLRTAWALVLEPCSVDDVRSAVAEYFRSYKYWPDVTDIASRCPKPEKPAPTMTHWSQKEIHRVSEQLDEMLELGALMQRDYIAAGLPHPSEARNMGWTSKEWCRRCREATS